MRALCLVLLLWLPNWAAAQSASDFERALRLPELAAILAEEAARTGADVDADLLNGQGGSVFAAQIAQINDPGRLSQQIADILAGALTAETARAILAFTNSEQAQAAVALELSARQAFLDPDVEEFARSSAEASPSRDLVDRLIAAGDMVGKNRETARLTTAAFYRGLREGGAVDLSDAAIDQLAGEQASGMDEDTRAWLAGFFTLAYSPLDRAELEVLTAFWESDVGLAFSDALFEAFDTAYAERWFAMGRAAALFLSSEDI
ncbi:MAG: hypothetical protein AAGM84_17890 [Pseudomonadota bacterium]